MKLYRKLLIGLVIAVLLGAAIFVISAILPDRAYKAYTSSNNIYYIYIYPHKVARVYRDQFRNTHFMGMNLSTMLIDSSTTVVDNQQTLFLKYARPGEKGANYRESITINDTSAIYNGITYSRTTPWSIFIQ